jgi:hypothetical protein
MIKPVLYVIRGKRITAAALGAPTPEVVVGQLVAGGALPYIRNL